MTPGIAIVFGLVLLAGVLFALPRVPAGVAALAIAVLLAVLGPWTGIGPADALAGFASPATVTVLAMFILSEGVRRTGVIGRLGRALLRLTEGSASRRLAAILALGGPPAGLVNNTPVVAVLIPTVVDLARRSRSSPSRLLIPLSFVSMLGGTLTLIGTSTNLLAADLSVRLLDRPIGMFEFTPVGAVILATGALYLFTLGRWLVPDRIPPEADLTETYDLRDHLWRLRVGPDSPLLGRTLGEAAGGREDFDLDILQIQRGRTTFLGPTTDQVVVRGDLLTLRAELATAERYAAEMGLELLARADVSDALFMDRDHTLLELTLPARSRLAGRTPVESAFRSRLQATVLAIRRGDAIRRGRIERTPLQEGDSLLVLVPVAAWAVIDEEPDVLVTRATPRETAEPPAPDGERTERPSAAVALGIVGLVILLPTLGWIPISIAALAGVVAMVATGVVEVPAAYRAVQWDIVFLLAGVLPLGEAMARTGAAAWLAEGLVGAAAGLPPVVLLGGFYVLTSLLTNVMSNNASVVLMIPVALDAAAAVGAAPFAFLLVVTFAASTAFMTPVGYQTNLMVYTPGGYRFTDFARIGAPLQVLLAVVTPLAIAGWFGL